MKWRSGSSGHTYDCGEDVVVYFDSASGDTHLISEFAAFIMRKISDAGSPLDVQGIIELITDDIEEQDLPELSLAIPEILTELVALDIVTPA